MLTLNYLKIKCVIPDCLVFIKKGLNFVKNIKNSILDKSLNNI